MKKYQIVTILITAVLLIWFLLDKEYFFDLLPLDQNIKDILELSGLYLWGIVAPVLIISGVIIVYGEKLFNALSRK